MHGRRQVVALALAALALAACGGGDKSTGPGTLAGNYTMRSFNGANLPAILFQSGSDRVEVTGGSVTMNADNSFTGVTTIRETSGGQAQPPVSFSCAGTYTRSGNSVSFTEPETEDCGGTYPGTLSGGNTLTVNFAPGIQAVFKK